MNLASNRHASSSHEIPLPATVVNANAGRMLRDPGLLPGIEQCLDGRAELHLTRDLEELDRVARSLAERQVGHVAICGGDGSAAATLGALWRFYPRGQLPLISLLRGGTMNTVARSLAVARRSPQGLLQDLVQRGKRRSLRLCTVHTLRIGERLGFLFGTGFMVGFLEQYYSAGREKTGPGRALQLMAQVSVDSLRGGDSLREMMRPRDVELTLDGRRWPEQPYLALTAGTVREMGLGFSPFHRMAKASDGFQMLGIDATPRQLVRQLPRIWAGQPMRGGLACDLIGRQATLRSADGPMPYFIDGDLFCDGSTLQIELGPRVRIVLGR